MDEPPEGASQPSEGIPGVPRQPEGPAADALAAEAAEIRRMIDAGASSPEELRELAQRLREHREREEALWRAEVRPILKKEGKGRLRGFAPKEPGPVGADDGPRGAGLLWAGLALLAMVVVVMLAANTTIWVLVVPIVGLLVWAWKQGQSQGS